MNRVDQHLDIFRRCELADAVSEVKNMRWTGRFGIQMWLAKAVQHLDCLGLDLGRTGKQHIGVEVTLQRFCAAPGFVIRADLRARLAQIHRPVQAQHIAVHAAVGLAVTLK